MHNWFRNLTYKMQRFMYGRYGMDEFSIFLTVAGMVLALVSVLPFLNFFGIFAFAFIIWSYVRCFSKNFDKRRRERAKYLSLKSKITSKISLHRRRFRERKTHRYYKCPMCRTLLRVPRGRGKIQITCPKCKDKMIKKT